MHPDKEKAARGNGTAYQYLLGKNTPNQKQNQCPSCGYKAAFSARFVDGRWLYKCHVGCSQPDVLAALRGFEAKGSSSWYDAVVSNRESNTGNIASQLWQSAMPAQGTLVELYLRHRSITLSLPNCIRFLSKHRHNPSGTDWPIMLAAITNLQGDIVAVHRTYLAKEGIGKAPVEPAKMTLGPIAGGSVQLAPAGEKLAIAEGIETALSVMQATGIPSWAAVNAGNISALILPPLPLASEVIIAADHDTHGVGQAAARRAAELWATQGRKVRIAIPPKPDADFNDLLMNGGSHA